MGLWNKFPFTNFHEVNTDWIISEVKNVLKRMDTLEDKTEADLLALAKQIVGIQEDVDVKLNNIDATIAQKAAEEVQRLVEEGRFDELITPALEQLSKDLRGEIDAATTAASRALVNTNKTQYLDTLAGKRILIIGDSNSDESFTGSAGAGNIHKHWTSELTNLLNAKASGNGISVTNRSMAGKPMSYATEILTEINATSTRYDIIIIMLGTNDYNANTDYAEFSTTLSSVSTLLQPHVKTKGCQVYFVSPPKRLYNFRDKDGQTPLVIYAREIYRNCIENGFNFIDAWCKIPEINLNKEESRKIWFADQYLHFSDLYAPIFAKWILGYLVDNRSDEIGDYYEEHRGASLVKFFTNTNNFEFDSANSNISVGSKRILLNIRGKLKQGGANTTGIQPIMNVPSWMIAPVNYTPVTCMWTSFQRGSTPAPTTAFINNGAKTLYADITGNSETGKTYFMVGTIEALSNQVTKH